MVTEKCLAVLIEHLSCMPCDGTGGINLHPFACSFQLPQKQQLLGLPAGQHVMVRVPKRGGGFWERPFNPTSTDAQPGVVEFLVKVRPQQSSWGPTCLWQPQVLPEA